MSAPTPTNNPAITTIMKEFLKEITEIEFVRKHNYLAMIERGASAIIHSYCLSFYDSPEDPSCANEAASTAASRFIQFLNQAQKEGGDTLILSQALPFSLKGRTNSKVIGNHSSISKIQDSFIKVLITKQLHFVDLVQSFVNSTKSQDELEQIFTEHWQIMLV